MEIKVGWKTYKFVHNEKLVDEDGRECYKQKDFNDNIIELREANNNKQMIAIAIRKVLFGINDMYRINLKEVDIANLANYLTCVAFDNPKLMTYFANEVNRLSENNNL